MEWKQLLSAVTNERIEFVTAGREDAALPTLGRRVLVTGPPDAVRLMSAGDPDMLEALIGLLPDVDRAWAAEVVLASLTRHEEDIVNAFANRPRQWQDTVGANAYARWNEWLAAHRGKLRWDSRAHAFVAANGR